MKTIADMQLEMIEKARIERERTESVYPKEIWLNAGLMPVLALARDGEQEKKLLRENEIGLLIPIIGLCLIGTVFVIGVIIALLS